MRWAVGPQGPAYAPLNSIVSPNSAASPPDPLVDEGLAARILAVASWRQRVARSGATIACL